MMRGFGERKNWIVYTILAITIVIGFVCASGCPNIFGATKTDEETTPTPRETPTGDITQVTQAMETSGPGASGGSSGSGCDCERHAFINQQFDGVEYRLVEQLTTSCFHLVSHSTRVENEPLKPINPQPEEYYFNSLFIDNLGGEFDENGREIKSRETIELYFNGNPEELVKTLTSESSLNDLSSHTYRMWKNKDAVINQIKPIDAFLKDYERMPVSAQIKPAKNEVNAGETIDVTVENLNDDKGRSPQPFQRVLVKAEHGKILGGTQAGKYKVFKATDSSIKFQYQAPDSCDKATSDTITIYNSCDIADKVQPLASTTPKKQIGSKTIKIICDTDGEIELYYWTWEGCKNGKATIPFTIDRQKEPPIIHGSGYYVVTTSCSFFNYRLDGNAKIPIIIYGEVFDKDSRSKSPYVHLEYQENWNGIVPIRRTWVNGKVEDETDSPWGLGGWIYQSHSFAGLREGETTSGLKVLKDDPEHKIFAGCWRNEYKDNYREVAFLDVKNATGKIYSFNLKNKK
jgi:hypothetical protein